MRFQLSRNSMLTTLQFKLKPNFFTFRVFIYFIKHLLSLIKDTDVLHKNLKGKEINFPNLKKLLEVEA